MTTKILSFFFQKKKGGLDIVKKVCQTQPHFSNICQGGDESSTYTTERERLVTQETISFLLTTLNTVLTSERYYLICTVKLRQKAKQSSFVSRIPLPPYFITNFRRQKINRRTSINDVRFQGWQEVLKSLVIGQKLADMVGRQVNGQKMSDVIYGCSLEVVVSGIGSLLRIT